MGLGLGEPFLSQGHLPRQQSRARPHGVAYGLGPANAARLTINGSRAGPLCPVNATLEPTAPAPCRWRRPAFSEPAIFGTSCPIRSRRTRPGAWQSGWRLSRLIVCRLSLPSRSARTSVRWLWLKPTYGSDIIGDRVAGLAAPVAVDQCGSPIPPVGRQDSPDLAFADPQNFGRLSPGKLIFHHAVEHLESCLFSLVQCHVLHRRTFSLSTSRGRYRRAMTTWGSHF